MSMLDKVKGSIPFIHKEEQANSEEKPEGTTEEENTGITEQDMLGEILKKLTGLTEGFQQKLTEQEEKLKQMESMIEEVKTKPKDNEGDSELKERVDRIDKTLEEFSGMYELISKQYNPFLNKDEKKHEPQQTAPQPAHHVVVEDKITGNTTKVHQGEHKEEHQEKHAEEKKEAPKKETTPEEHKKMLDEIKEVNTVSDDMKKELIDTMIEEKQKNKSLTQQVDDEHKFSTPECKPITSLMGLVHALNNPKITVFDHHVKEKEDHFADWIEHALQMKELANKLRKIKDKQKYIATILSQG